MGAGRARRRARPRLADQVRVRQAPVAGLPTADDAGQRAPAAAPLPLDTAEARRIEALTSCTDLLAAYEEAADRADRLREAGDTDAAWSARSYVRLADNRLQKLRC